MRQRPLALLLLLLLAACGSTTADVTGGVDAALDAPPGDDTGTPAADSSPATDAPPEAGDVDSGFVVRRLPCVPTNQLAGDLPTNVYGAVEAELIAITPPDTHTACPNDSGHVHLQLDVTGKRYDVAVNVESTTGSEMAIFTKDLSPQLPALGYRAATFDFPTDLAAHSTDFQTLAKADLVTRVETELANASRVSIYGLTYTDGTGIHDIHRYGNRHDGVILIRRGGAGGTDHAVALRFSTDVF